MAEQTVELAPGESKVVTFGAVPHEAKTYHVSVDGLTGSFKAVALPLEVIRYYPTPTKIFALQRTLTDIYGRALPPDPTMAGLLDSISLDGVMVEVIENVPLKTITVTQRPGTAGYVEPVGVHPIPLVRVRYSVNTPSVRNTASGWTIQFYLMPTPADWSIGYAGNLKMPDSVTRFNDADFGSVWHTFVEYGPWTANNPSTFGVAGVWAVAAITTGIYRRSTYISLDKYRVAMWVSKPIPNGTYSLILDALINFPSNFLEAPYGHTGFKIADIKVNW